NRRVGAYPRVQPDPPVRAFSLAVVGGGGPVNLVLLGGSKMSPHQTLAVAVRLFAIWLAIYVVRMAPWVYRETLKADDIVASTIVIFLVAAALLFIFLLWFFPRSIARGLLDAKNLSSAEPPSADLWFALG